MSLSPNTTLAHYSIISKIGEGGMGEVYLADDTRLHRRVALKVLPENIAADSDRLRRFEREAFAVSALNHPNIVTIYEFGQENGRHFLASEFVDGESLRQRINKGLLKLTETLEIAIQIVSALQAAHEAGIVHRDIKPDNVMIRADGYVKVLDFGLAKLAGLPAPVSGRDSSEDSTRMQLQTQSGIVVGTVAYMSPEQARGQEVDARTDIWGLGCVLYEMITGERPFKGETTTDTLANIIHREPVPIQTVRTDAPGELQRISNQTLKKNKTERYQTATDLLADLKQLQKRLEFKAELTRSDGEDRTQIIPPQTTTRTGGTNSIAPTNANRGVRKFVFVAVAACAMLVLSMLTYSYLNANKSSIGSIAVLPFENSTGDGDLDYLSDGLSESLIDKLSQLPQLKVIARTSSFKYRGPNIDVNDVANRLGVRAIIMGKVARVGDSLTVRVEMVDAPENRQIWSEQYSRKATDLLFIQQEIAQVASEKLRLRLTGAQEQQLARRGTQDPHAYELLLRGRLFRNKGGSDNLKKAHECFRQAIAADAAYALAYAELGESFRHFAGRGVMDPKEAIPKAKEAITKALELDDHLAEAHMVMGYDKQNDWDWPGAEHEFRRAIDLNPNLARAREGYSRYLSLMGRHDAAISEMKRARELDPLSLRIITSLGDRYISARRYDDALNALQVAVELDPNFDSAHIYLGYTYSAKGMYREAITEYEKAIQLGAREAGTRIYLAAAYAGAGEHNRARLTLKQLEDGNEYVSPAELAILYAALGEWERALASLERAYKERDLQLKFLTTEPGYDPIRSEPRFKELVRKLGLPDS